MNIKLSSALFLAITSMFAGPSFAADRSGTTCADLPKFADLQTALATAVTAVTAKVDAFGLPMWATLVDSSGRVCAVAKLNGTDPWLGSRVISAQKANTANAFSTENIALSTANLYAAVQPGGSLFGLQHSNPVNTLAAYRGAATNFGTANDPMVGLRVGGVNVFGGGLALYNTSKQAIGAIGVSGDSSCADHAIAWKLRTSLVGKGSGLGLVANKVPGGVNKESNDIFDDNIIYDIVPVGNGNNGTSTSGWGQPHCAFGPTKEFAPAVGALTN